MLFINWSVLPAIHEAQLISQAILNQTEKAYKQAAKDEELIIANHKMILEIRQELKELRGSVQRIK